MLISYGRPTASAITIAGSGAAFVVEAAALVDGDQGRCAKFTWTDSVQTTAEYVAIRVAFATATFFRVLGLLNLVGAPNGVVVKVFGKRAADAGYTYDLGGNSQSGAAVLLPSGICSAWFVLDSAVEALVGLEFRIYNDAGGSTWIATSAEQELGELWYGPAVEPEVARGWEHEPVDTTIVRRTLGGQVDAVEGAFYRRLPLKLVPGDVSNFRGGGLSGGQDIETLQHALAGAARCVVITRTTDTAGAWSEQELHRTAMFGYASKQQGIGHVSGPLYEGGWTFEEIPA